MDIVGYSDRLSVASGQTIRFMVSCQSGHYQANIVRLIHGDLNSQGPGFKKESVETPIDGVYAGRRQEISPGSHVVVPDHPLLRSLKSFSLQAWVYPTAPARHAQGLVTKWSDSDQAGFAIVREDDGSLGLWIGGGGMVARFRTEARLRERVWYFVVSSFDSSTGQVRLHQEPLRAWPLDRSGASIEWVSEVRPDADNGVPLLMGGYCATSNREAARVLGHFNGKLDNPRLFPRALTDEDLHMLKVDDWIGDEPFVAAWDFAVDVSGSGVVDKSGNDLHGIAVNMPTRAVTGHAWRQRNERVSDAPAEYSAIHFHDDDLVDAGWDVDFDFDVPDDFRSGIYAVHLRSQRGEDCIPFFVRPRSGAPSARVVFLVPTFSYLAYANDQMMNDPGRQASFGLTLEEALAEGTSNERAAFRYIVENRLLSLYDRHSDGSGTCYSSRLRPILNMRPKYNKPSLGFSAPHQFNADLYIVDWLDAKGHPFDVVTDEDLHREGIGLLAPYQVVITGSHPEYWSEPMIDALNEYLVGGGRTIYLGGNGFYWVTSSDPERPHVIEVRRGEAGMRTWQAEPGEHFHSTTGERGGLWRSRGRTPQALVGVGFSAHGGDRASPYRREQGSFDARVAFIFEGISDDEIIGDFGLHMGAAGGWELDRVDYALGSPPHTLVLASTFGHSDSYQHTVEEIFETDNRQGGTVNPLVRADMAYVEYPNGGAVFSTGSISWSGSLSHNAYDNNVSRIMENVLKHFVGE